MKDNLHRRGILFMIFLMLFGQLFSIAFFVMFTLLRWYIFYEAEIDWLYVMTSPWMVIFQQIMFLLVPLAIWLSLFREKLNEHLPHMKLGNTNVLLIIAITLMLVPAMYFISWLTMLFFPNEIGGFMLDAMTRHPLFLILLAVAVTPAICEEVVFRGYIQSTYRHKPLVVMFVMNGLFFAVIHHSPQQFVYVFVMGIVFAYMVHATRSIRAGVISHFVFNATSSTLGWLALNFGNVPEEAAEAPQVEVWHQIMVWGVIVVITTTIAAFLLLEFAKHNKKRTAEYDAMIKEEAIEESIGEPTEEPPQVKHKLFDAALVLVIVALYVIFVLV